MSGLFAFIRRYMVPFWHWYLAGTIALMATNWIRVTIPLHLARGVDALVAGSDGLATVGRSALIVGVLGLVVIGVRTLSRVLYFTPGRLVEAQVKRDLFARILAHQPAFLHKWETGDLFSRISSDVNMLRLLAGFGVLQLVNAVVAVVMASAQMLRLDATLTLWMLPPILVGLGVVQAFIARMFRLIKVMQVQQASLSSHVLASYRGVATVQGFDAEGAFVDRFEGHNQALLGTTVERSAIRALLGPTLALMTDVNVFLILLIGGPRVISGAMTVGELVAFTTLVAFVAAPLRSSSFLYSIVKQAQAALERVDAILAEEPERPDLEDPQPAPTTAPAIEVRHLTFAYPDADTPTLQDVSFTLPAGKTLGVLGLTGAGKSTLLSVLSRLYNPPPGTVFVDGVDITTIDLHGWRDAMTLVPQRPFLFSESLADNVLLGRDDPALLATAIDLAALAPDLAALPKGTDTLVGESGVRLSGGQRQRTALARGLVREHRVLLLDDVLSAVDHATEKQLIGTLQDASHGGAVTTVLVAHRVSALQHADVVVVLDEGRVADVDTPDALLARPGLFRDTWIQQQAEAS